MVQSYEGYEEQISHRQQFIPCPSAYSNPEMCQQHRAGAGDGAASHPLLGGHFAIRASPLVLLT